MNKNIKVAVILMLLIFMIGCTDNQKNESENKTTAEVTQGVNQLTTEQLLEKIRKISSKYPEEKYIEVDGYKISEREIEIAMLYGRTKEEAIQWRLSSLKRGDGIRRVSSDFENVIPSEEEVYEYKELIMPSTSNLSGDDLEIFLLTSGFSSYDEYLNSEKTFSSVELMLIEKNIIETLKKVEMDSNITDLEATENAKEKLEELIEKELNN